MERKTKEMLKQYYEAPEAAGKRQFLRARKPEKISMTHMVQTQLHYISKKMWIVSAALILLVVALHNYFDMKWMGSICALVPFLVMLSLTECMRSYRYGMEELELAARFSLKSVVLCRMLILGIVNLLFLSVLAVAAGSHFWVGLVYLLAPFLVTSSGGLVIVRHFAGKDGTYYCFVFSALVSVAECVISLEYDYVYELRNFGGWALVCVVFTFVLIRESLRTIRMTEELAWN